MTWPTDDKGLTDWESAFEHPETGLVSMVAAAQNSKTVRKVTTLLVEQLFIRTGDTEQRDRYRKTLSEIFSDDGHPVDAVKERAVDFLRAIKTERIERAGQDREPDPHDLPVDDPRDPAVLFRHAFLKQFDERFDVLCDGIDEATELPVTRPCYISPAFAKHFRGVVERHFVEPVLARNKTILSNAELKDPNERAAFIEQTFQDRTFRTRQFDMWKLVWAELTEQREPPKKPVVQKKGMLKKLIDKAEQKPKRRGELTLEEWEVEVARVKAQNKAAAEVWAEICAPSEEYDAPTDADRDILMGLPGRTAAGIQKHITAIVQIALQGRSTSAFDSYQHGRPVDLSLLAASFRYPEVFVGEVGFLRDIMRGYKKAPRQAAFPLISRYMIDIETDLFAPGIVEVPEEEEEPKEVVLVHGT